MHLPHTLHCWHVWCYILRIHNTYLQRKCFLSWLYNDTSCFVQRQSTLLCLATHRFTRGVPLLRAVHYAQTDVTFVAEVQHAPCLFFQQTQATLPLFSFGRPVLWMFDAKSFMFLWNILPKNHLSFIQHDDFIHGKVFSWIVHFTKFVAQSVKNLSYFPKSLVVWVITAQRVVIVFKMEES